MKLRDRIKELRRVKARDLLPNPKNWRIHPQAQRDALRCVLAEIGMADALLVRETPAGLMLIDGHARFEEAPEDEWPVLVLDVTEDEADKLLATLDPLVAAAEADQDKLASLLASIEAETEGLQKFLLDLAAENSAGQAVEIKNLVVKQPPKMAWVLVGIPVVRFVEIASLVEQIVQLPEVFCEMTVNDDAKKN